MFSIACLPHQWVGERHVLFPRVPMHAMRLSVRVQYTVHYITVQHAVQFTVISYTLLRYDHFGLE